MADKKISQLDNGGNIQNTDDIPIVRGGANFKAQIANRQLLITSPTNDNIVITDANGQTKDSGIGISEIASLPIDLASSEVTGTLPNNKTTATSSNSASSIVARDSSGNFSAGTISAALNGNATSANTATTANFATSATTATNIAGGASGSIPYQTAAGTTSFIPSGTGVLIGGTTPGYTNAPTLSGTNFTNIPNSATTATSNNTASTIVTRDSSGNFSAGTITATLNGNASSSTTSTSATSATTATNLAGGSAGSIPYQSSSGTTSLLAAGTGVLVGGATPSYSTAPALVGTNFTGIPNSATTATSTNTNNAIVARDASGNFSAGTITANLSGSASLASSLNGGSAGTIPYQNSVNSTSMLSPVTNGILVGGSTPQYVINSNAQSGFLFQANSGVPGFTALTTSNLTDYIDASWTPVDSSGGVTITVLAARYISIGGLVTCWAKISYPPTSDTNNSVIGGLPFTIANAVYNQAIVSVLSSNGTAAKGGRGIPNTTTFILTDANGNPVTNANNSGATLWLRIVYKK